MNSTEKKDRQRRRIIGQQKRAVPYETALSIDQVAGRCFSSIRSGPFIYCVTQPPQPVQPGIVQPGVGQQVGCGQQTGT